MILYNNIYSIEIVGKRLLHKKPICVYRFIQTVQILLSFTDSVRENDVSKEGNHIVVPQIVSQVTERFVAAMRKDLDIPDDAIDRLEILLRKDIVPKPDDINVAMFELPTEGKT